MASIFDLGAWRQAAGQTLQDLGNAAGIPEMGISEIIAGGPTPSTVGKASAQSTAPSYSPLLNYTPAGGNQLIPASFGDPASTFYQNPTPTPNPTPSAPPTSELDKLMAMAREGSINPTQRSRLAELLLGKQPDMSQQINDAYNPTMDYFNKLQGQLEGNRQSDINDVNNRYQTYLDRLPTEKAQSEADIQRNETGVNQQLTSAYDQAVRAYNALSQKGIARFGAGSSAGQALGELANQEFLRNQGNVSNQGIQSAQQFAAQRQKLNDYITQKAEDFRLQKDDALKQLDRNLQQSLNQINASRAQTEQAKAQMKLQAIQTAMTQAQQVEQADKAFKQNLALSLVQNMANVAGRSFTPTQIMAQIPQIINMLNGQPVSPEASPMLQGGNILSGNPQDQLLQGGNIMAGNNGNEFSPQDYLSLFNGTADVAR